MLSGSAQLRRSSLKTLWCSRCDRRKPIKNFRFVTRRGRKEYQYDCNICHAEGQRRRVKTNPRKYNRIYRNAYLKGEYGITLLQYEAQRRKQKNYCACCGQKETRINPKSGKVQRLSVDHNHKTGENRELLCVFCNLYLIPALETFPHFVDKAKAYLRRHHVCSL
jgi:recombination endonuclease VII